MAYSIPDDMNGVRPLLMNARIPALSACTIDGEMVDLNAVVQARPTILLFYRGGWCGFCRGQLAELQENYEALADLGFRLVAISPDSPENTRETVENLRLTFPVLSDSSMAAAIALGTAWRVTDRDEAYYEKLRRASGESHRLLPTPAYFFLDTDGTILYEYVNPNYRVRPPFFLMLAAAQAVRQQLELRNRS